MSDEEKDKLYKVMAGVVALAVMLSTAVNTAIQKITPEVRYEAFTASDGAVHERRLDSLELRLSGCDSKMRQYVDGEFKAEQKECSKYRREIEKRLSRAEWLQQQVISTLRNRGLELDIRGEK